MTEEVQVEPLFDSSKSALEFALNYSRTRYAQPFMTKVMNEAQRAKAPKPKKLRRKQEDGTFKMIEAPEPEVTKRFRDSPRPSLQGLDHAAQAGMILLHLAKLPEAEHLTLICSTVNPRLPCSCSSPCCMGFKLNPEWSDGIGGLCRLLEDEQGPRLRKDHPKMRRALVEKFFGGGRRIVQAELADECQVTEATVVAHRKKIEDFLSEAAKNGWTRLDGFLVAAGIVGDLS